MGGRQSKRAAGIVLRDRLVDWLGRTRRAETDELVSGIVARTARLGDHLVIHETDYRAHGVLIVANAASGAIAFLAEWTPDKESSLIATPEVMAALGRDLDGMPSGKALH